MSTQATTRRAALAGAAAGLVNGIFGGGGGMVLIPLLIHRVGLADKQAFATSVCIMLPISIVSALVYWLRTDLVLSAALPYLAGGLLGGLLSGKLFRFVPVGLLRKLLALLLLWGGLRFLR